MTNAITEAVGAALKKEFGDDYSICMEETEPGAEKSCFSISCVKLAGEPLPGNRHLQTNRFRIRYVPADGGNWQECGDAAERMRQCLEYITLCGADRPVRGTKMSGEVTDGILNFFVNYDCIVRRVEEQERMEQLKRQTDVKGGE